MFVVTLIIGLFFACRPADVERPAHAQALLAMSTGVVGKWIEPIQGMGVAWSRADIREERLKADNLGAPASANPCAFGSVSFITGVLWVEAPAFGGVKRPVLGCVPHFYLRGVAFTDGPEWLLFSNRTAYGILNTPAVADIESAENGANRNAGFVGPVHEALGATKCRNHPVGPLAPGLLCSSGPAAIHGPVVSDTVITGAAGVAQVAIDPVQATAIWTLAHVGEKRLETSRPASAHHDAPATVVSPSPLIIRVIAPGFGATPRDVRRRFTHAVGTASGREFLFVEAAATGCVATAKQPADYDLLLSTVAQAEPFSLAVLSASAIQGDDDKSAISLANHVYSPIVIGGNDLADSVHDSRPIHEACT